MWLIGLYSLVGRPLDKPPRESQDGCFKCTFAGIMACVEGKKNMELNRRQFLTAGTVGVAATVLTSASPRAIMPPHSLRIALLHLAPIPGDLAYNRGLVETAVTAAAGLGAAWIITPELCICGYAFADQIGTDWILPQPDPWMKDFCQLVARLQVTVFLSHPERDRQTGKLYNSVFVIAANGAILGKHRKINTLQVDGRIVVESWERGYPHPGFTLWQRRGADLCGCVFVGDC